MARISVLLPVLVRLPGRRSRHAAHGETYLPDRPGSRYQPGIAQVAGLGPGSSVRAVRLIYENVASSGAWFGAAELMALLPDATAVGLLAGALGAG